MIVVLGQGNWGKRLKKEYTFQGCSVKTWSHSDEVFEINDAEQIVVAVPSPYLLNTLQKFKVNPLIPVLTATKGLDELGRLPSETIRQTWKSQNIGVIGGACISTELYIQMIVEDSCTPLEKIGILKNVYAVGFNIVREEKGDNAAAMWFVDAWRELKEIAIQDYYLSDLVVTCMSGKSRNAKAGSLIARGVQGDPEKFLYYFDGQVPEGVFSAKMIGKYDLFPTLQLLRSIIDKIEKRRSDI